MSSGKIIFLNGASSSGKSTLAVALQASLHEPFWHFSVDHLADAKVLPRDRIKSGEFSWKKLRPSFMEGFRRCLPALALACNNLIVEHIFETQPEYDQLVALLEGFDVFWVGIHCPLEELEKREALRGDRPVGDAKRDFEIAHTFRVYDFEVCSTEPVEENVRALIDAWQRRRG